MDEKLAFLERAISDLESAPGGGTLFACVRLAESAAAMTPGAFRMPFGLSVEDETRVAAAPLRERAIAVLARWSALLAPKEQTSLAKSMKPLGLPVFVTVRTPKPRARVLFTIPVAASDTDTGEPVTLPSVLACFDGAKAWGGDEIHTLPCISDATGATSELFGEEGWAIGSSAVLAYLEDENRLTLRLAIDARRSPPKKELQRLVTAVREELFMSGFGMNLDWEDVKGEPNATLGVHEEELTFEVVKLGR
jgi:hypothetical protein